MSTNPTVVFTAKDRVVVEDREVPTPEPGQLLVRTLRSIISTGTELTMLSGDYAAGSVWDQVTGYPCVPGYSNIGEVVSAGADVPDEWVGRKVATYGRHAAYVTVAHSDARPVRRDLPDEQAALFTIGEIVMNGVRRGRVTWGECAVVYGLGLLGQLAARYCHLAGARPVVGVDVADSRLALLPDATGFRRVNPTRRPVREAVEEWTRGRLADVAFEVTGVPSLIASEFAALRRQGRLVILSSPRGTTEFDFHDLCNWPSTTIIGAHNGSHPAQATGDNPWTQHRHCELFFDLVADGELDVAPLITHRASWRDAPAMYAMLLADRSQAMAVVLEWTD